MAERMYFGGHSWHRRISGYSLRVANGIINTKNNEHLESQMKTSPMG